MKPTYLRILVVEDSPNDQLLIQRAFTKIGVSAPVYFASNGAEAIAYMKGEGKFSDRNTYPYPGFIITDLKMPVADGFAVLEHLQSHPLSRIIPTVVLSASHDEDDICKAYLLGASSYHVKPPRFEDLLQQLRLFFEYWRTCEVPRVDSAGKQLPTASCGKLGERFSKKD
jgi:CheY-like chemotaxis protein